MKLIDALPVDYISASGWCGLFFVRTRDYRYANVHHPTLSSEDPARSRLRTERVSWPGGSGMSELPRRSASNNMLGSRVFISTTNVAGSSPPRRDDDVIDRDRIFPTPWGIAVDSKLLAVLCLLFLTPPAGNIIHTYHKPNRPSSHDDRKPCPCCAVS